jgi:hypothetical protein
MDEFTEADERRCLGTAHAELVRAREALREAERFLNHTRVAKQPGSMSALKEAKDRVVTLASSVKVALDEWDEEHPVT